MKRFLALLLSISTILLICSCSRTLPDNKRIEFFNDLAEVVNDNYSCEDEEEPLCISMYSIEGLTGDDRVHITGSIDNSNYIV